MAARLDATTATTETLKDTSTDFQVPQISLDTPSVGELTEWTFPEADRNLSYFKSIPEVYSAIKSLAIWTVGRGFEVDVRTKIILDNLNGWGEDTFISMMANLIIQKKVQGDAFLEIVRNEETGALINIKPIYTGDMVIELDGKGLITGYRQRNLDGKDIPFKPNEIFHVSNDRYGNEIHGTSVIDVCRFVIDAKNEAMADERMIKHNELVAGILYVDTENVTKRNALLTEYVKALKTGKALAFPKDTAEVKYPPATHQQRLEWLRYLDSFFYVAIGVPKPIVNVEGFAEAASKMGFMTFDPVYTFEQVLLEADIWNQLALRVKANRPPSLHGVMEENQQKNVGQVGIQQNDIQPGVNRSE